MTHNPEIRIKVRDLKFSYPLLHKRSSVFKTQGIENQININQLEIRSNQSIGLVGNNGAGKTTLLRLLAGIYEPNGGEVFINGRIATLFDAGFGLDLESNAPRNIKIRGMLLERSKDEIATAIDEIEEFSDLGAKWLEPVRTYSSGMVSRIVIGLATAFESEVLLMDEGIGASDISFQKKAKNKFEELLKSTGSIVMASHNQELMEDHCNSAILLRNGEIYAEDSVTKIWQLHRKLSNH